MATHHSLTPAGSPAPATGTGVVTASRVFVGRAVRHSVRDVEALLMAVVLPVLLMLVFTFVLGGAIAPDGTYLDYVVPGIVLTCAGFGASFTGVAVSNDLTSGTIDRLRTMPVPGATVLVGHTVASLARNLVATAVVLLVAVGLGHRPAAGPVAWAAAVGLIALYILAITSVFALLGLLARSPEAVTGYGFGLLFLPYVSSAFVPVETMPGWLQGIAAHQPLTPVVEAVRALLGGGAPGGDAFLAVAWCAGIVLATAAATAYLWPRRASR
ncbi:multidrug efflux ABC transporter permease LieB [Ornithinimicrobium humiphilum]|uniref:Transport permease protein n=1 Tax=Ornithinimicrobium humiphilum TaxID=125288 RepID=A0A543KNR0_9MICO|nr:ABC transporter permease [Ornithinimicrobium humiphilum]TQM96717.1 ABC-2 type transport system permease protein [Ornithinimicrobium humiphilum]